MVKENWERRTKARKCILSRCKKQPPELYNKSQERICNRTCQAWIKLNVKIVSCKWLQMFKVTMAAHWLGIFQKELFTQKGVKFCADALSHYDKNKNFRDNNPTSQHFWTPAMFQVLYHLLGPCREIRTSLYSQCTTEHKHIHKYINDIINIIYFFRKNQRRLVEVVNIWLNPKESLRLNFPK